MNHKVFIVPHDFTPVADVALNHALATAKIVNARIYLLHVVNKAKDIDDAESKMKKIIDKLDTTIEIIPTARVGSIFEDIGDFASEHHAELIFMGTHGVKGWQNITGSRALKVIAHSDVPFIVVQQGNEVGSTGYDSIVVPLDLNKETKQKLGYVANLANYFNSKVHVVIPDETDDIFRAQIKVNIKFAQKFFSERNVNYDISFLNPNNFEKEVLKHAESINADLITIMNLHKANIFSSLVSNPEEYLLTNEANIPILILNPERRISSFSLG
jgi:nucleotide-binding universal stress UspA family protein